jgi:hypothetical protein
MKREKIIKDLESGKEYIEDENRIYFRTLNGYIVFLSKNQYFERLHKLQDYFSDREPNEARKLVLENLSIGANPIEEDVSNIKVTCVYQSGFATCFKIEGYPESWSDKDIMFKRSLTDARGNVLSDIQQESWNTAREREDPRMMELCREVLRRLRGGLKI